MSIIQINKLIVIVFISIIFICYNAKSDINNQSDTNDTEKYSLSLSISSGASLLLNKYEGYKQAQNKLKELFFYPTLKIMWRTNTLLNIGLESTYLTVMKDEDYQLTKFEAKMTAVPVSLLFNMNIWGIDIYAGFGVTFIESNINAFDDFSSSRIIAGNYIYGLGYNIPISKSLGVGIEAKVFYITSINKYITCLGVNFSYNLSTLFIAK